MTKTRWHKGDDGWKQTAAAEVGPSREDLLIIAAAEAHAEVIQRNIAATIERCARVADKMTEIFGHGRIAAAIRALEDVP